MKAAALAYLYPEEYPPPQELLDAQRIDRWGLLPRAGGLEDQPIGYLDRCAWASAVYNAFRGRLTAKNALRWFDANPDAYELYAEIKMQLMKDGLL